MERPREESIQQAAADVRNYLLECGACCVGFTDLSTVPDATESPFSAAISIGLSLRPEPILHLREKRQRPKEAEAPTQAALRELAAIAVRFLEGLGCRAEILEGHDRYGDGLSNELLAVRSGIAWIGKSSRPVTWDFGSAIRFMTVLTDADLPADGPTAASFCGDCRVCTEACIAGAPSGIKWEDGMSLTDFFDSDACNRRRQDLAAMGFDCRYCMSVCPFTLVYLSNCGIDMPQDSTD